MEFQGVVTALSEQGMGAVKGPDGRTYFVRGVWPHDEAVFRALPDEGPSSDRYGLAEMVQLVTPSAERVTPLCPHLGLRDHDCAGCPWMIGAYEHQLKYKRHRIVHALNRVSLDSSVVQEIWPSPQVLGYRSRAQFKTDGIKLGYSGRYGKSVASIQNCLILNQVMASHLKSLQGMLPKEEWQPSEGYPFVFIDIDDKTDLSGEVVINKRRPFSQTNAEQNQQMKSWMRERLGPLSGDSAVLELFGGSGNFTEVASSLGFQDILSIDIQGSALRILQERNLAGVRVLGLDLFSRAALPRLVKEASCSAPAVLIVNPPRSGLMQLSRLAAALESLSTILYVSCNPVSFAADAKKMVGFGFNLQEVQPVDMIPHTPHIEMLGLLTR
jgi:23S rRNA (uracil1939-C5)-methyltransferase